MRQIGIRMTVDASSVTTQVPQAARAYDRFAEATEQAAARASRSTTRVSMSIGDLVKSAAGLTIVAGAVRALADGLTALPQKGFAFTRDLEVSQTGMAGILGSMTAINGQQTSFNQGLTISSEMIRRLNDDALRTAATSQELVTVFQALLAPGLSARMTLEQIRELTVVGTNAVKSMGLDGGQVVQELRDLVAGGITPASSTLATALGLKDSDIAAAKASSEGLFTFLMKRLEGFKSSSESFGQTLKGTLDQFGEGATRVAAESMAPLIAAIKQAVGDASALMVTFDKAGNAQINPALVDSVRGYAEGAATALSVGRDVVSSLWEHREAITALAGAYAAFKLGQWGAEAVTAVRAQLDLAQAARLARVEAAAQAVGNTEVALTSRQKVAALVAELQARQAVAQAEVAATASRSAQLATTLEGIALSRTEVIAKMESARATMAQAEAQIQAARAAGAQSFALAAVREATDALSVAQARHAALVRELAVLGQQQARINTAVAATTVANTAAVTAEATATANLASAKGAAAAAARGFGAVVGALGGPVGIAIAAVAGLAMWLATLKSNADAAAKSGVQVARAERAAANGQRPEERDLAALRGQIEALKDRRDELLARGERKPAFRPSGDTISGDVLGLSPKPVSAKELDSEIATKEAQLARLTKASQQSVAANTEVTLTVAGTEQAWKRSTEGVKTASAAQEEYKQKLQATRSAFEAHKSMLEKTGASPDAIKAAQAEQLEVEKALAKARDQQLKGIAGSGAAAARAERQDLQAQIEGVKEGYKLLALQTADGLDAVDSLRKQELLNEYGAIQRRRDLQLEDLKNREQALTRELAIAQRQKDSAKEQARLKGEIRELDQQRTNVRNKSERDMQETLVAPQLALLNSTRQATAAIYDQASALEDENTVHVQAQQAVAKLTSAEDALNAMRGRSKTALLDLSIAQLERQRTDLEATDNVIPGYIEALEKRIEAEKRLRAATSASEGLDKSDEVRKKQLEDARKTSEDIRGVFRQGVMDALDNNDNTFASIGKSLKRTVITALADAFYDATIKQAVDNFSQLITQALKGTPGAKPPGGSSGGGLFGALWGGITTFLGFGSKTPTPTPNAKGGTYAAAGLSAYSSTLVDKPTLFPFAKGGIGLMGEAGTEGIFPLKRDSQGRLGVIGSPVGAGASINFAPINNLYIDSRSDRGAVMADVGRAMQENNKNQFEELQRLKVAPK